MMLAPKFVRVYMTDISNDDIDGDDDDDDDCYYYADGISWTSS